MSLLKKGRNKSSYRRLRGKHKGITWRKKIYAQAKREKADENCDRPCEEGKSVNTEC